MKRLAFLALLLSAAVGVGVNGQVRPNLIGIAPTPDIGSNADAFFDDSVLHDLRLNINVKDWQSLKDNYLDNTYYPCDLRWRDHVVRNIGIRSRGTGSRSGIKPGLRVDFDRYITDQKFLGLKSFVLRNNTQDPSNLHERVSMRFFRRLGLLAPREAHTKLYINDQYEGLYTIVESIDKRFLKRSLGEDDGYLFKYDYPADGTPYFFEDRGSNPEAYVPLPFKPETHEDDSRPEVIADLVKTINQSSDAAFRIAIAEYLDLRKFIQHVAAEVFLADNDGFLGDYGMNNFYFYRFQNQKLFTFIAWDKSEASKGSTTYSIWHNINGVPSDRQNRLMRRVLSYRDLYDFYLDTLVQYAASASEREAGSTDSRGWLEREVDREYRQVRDAALSDPEKPYSNDDFERAAADFTAFGRDRSAFVTGEVQSTRAATAGGGVSRVFRPR
jgi:spore coat protein H